MSYDDKADYSSEQTTWNWMQRRSPFSHLSSLLHERLRYTGIMFGTFRAYYSIARQNVSCDSPREGKGDTTGTVCIYEQEEYGA